MDKEYEFFAKNITSRHSMLDTMDKNNGEENNGFAQFKSKQEIIDHLSNGLTDANAEIDRLQAKLKEYETNFAKGRDIVNQRNELLKLLSQRDNTIERKSMEISMLEKQLEDAVSAKFDALARLDAAGGKKLSNLPHSLTNNRTEVMDQRSNQRRKRNQTENGERHGPHELQERSDNSAMDQSSDSASIQDELLSAVRLRRQSESTLDRNTSRWPDEDVIQSASTKNVKTGEAQKVFKIPNRRSPFITLKRIDAKNFVNK